MSIVELGKDHASRTVLQNTGDNGVDFITHFPGPLFDHHHGPIVQVTDSLTSTFSLFHNANTHVFAGEILWLQEALSPSNALVDILQMARTLIK